MLGIQLVFNFFSDSKVYTGTFFVSARSDLRFLQDIETFDLSRFSQVLKLSEVHDMDPQQRLLLESSEEILHELRTASPEGIDLLARLGVCVGSMTYNPFAGVPMCNSPTSLTSHSPAILANRISHVLDLKGCSLMVDAACSSSLQAIRLAFLEIRTGCPGVLAAGSSVICDLTTFRASEGLKLLSSVDRCKSFDESADGIARGEAPRSVFKNTTFPDLSINSCSDTVFFHFCLNILDCPTCFSGEGVAVLALQSDGSDVSRVKLLAACSEHNGRSAMLATPSADAQRQGLKRRMLL